MHILRYLKKEIINKLEPNKGVIIYGARQVGKTTLVKEILKNFDSKDYMFLSGEDRDVRVWLASQSVSTLKRFIGSTKLLVIDEAQKIDQIGLNLKLIVDHIEGIKVIATGSSSFELSNQVGEPLVGRKWQFTLYPISQLELQDTENKHETFSNISDRLIYGSYPDVVTAIGIKEKKEIINSIVDGYLYKDVLEFEEVKKSQKIIDILKLIAFQIGQEVSLHEIGNSVNLDSRTVERYLDLLEKVFIVKRVRGFSRNLRKEVTKTSRFYFYDNGIRNAIIENFNDLNTRNDVGQLWENYLFMERMKRNEYKNISANIYFWRTWDKKEIDLVEEREGKLFGYEFKWGEKVDAKAPKDWVNTYDNASYEVINKENYLDFIL